MPIGVDKPDPEGADDGGLLGSVPPTDPAVLQAILDGKLNNAHYAAIGRVAAAWSYFEALIDSRAIELASISTDLGMCFTANLGGSRAKLDTFIALVDLCCTDKAPLKLLHKLAKDTPALSERRNRAVHNVWFLNDPTNPLRLEATAKKKLRLLATPHSTESLLLLMESIYKHAHPFDELASLAGAARKPSLGTLAP